MNQTEQSRHIDFEGVHNFRDLGGIATAHAVTQFGVLYRSDRLSGFTKNDHRAFCELGIATVIDMRVADERNKAPNCLPQDPLVKQITREFWPQHTVRMISDINAGKLDQTGARAAMLKQYGALATDHLPDYRAVIDDLLSHSCTPSVFHCTSGKDRTGMVAAIILLAIGVPQDAVIADYVLTDGRVAKVDIFGRHVNPNVIEVVMAATPDYIQAAIDAMVSSYGSIEAYLTNGIRLNRQKREDLRALLFT